MLPTLENSQKFKTEFDNFKSKISQISNDALKKDLNDKLTQLLREVRFIDMQHQELFTKKEIPSMVTDSRNKLAEIRKYIIKKLDDWDRARS